MELWDIVGSKWASKTGLSVVAVQAAEVVGGEIVVKIGSSWTSLSDLKANWYPAPMSLPDPGGMADVVTDTVADMEG